MSKIFKKKIIDHEIYIINKQRKLANTRIIRGKNVRIKIYTRFDN